MVADRAEGEDGGVRILVLGASGLIGSSLVHDLANTLGMDRGAPAYRPVAVARRFPRGPAPAGVERMEAPFVEMEPAALAALLDAAAPAVIVNCVGVLQDPRGARTARASGASGASGANGTTRASVGAGANVLAVGSGGTHDVHAGFTARLVQAARSLRVPPTLVHLSVPGDPAQDATPFSRTKREGERIVEGSGLPHAILRPGFVVTPSAYGGSALVRALAMTPVGLSHREAERPFAVVAAADIARTVAWIADERDAGRGADLAARWDLMHPDTPSVEEVVEAHRQWLGGPRALMRAPAWLQGVGSVLADAAGRLGWRPPIRSTALAELRRGITGEPREWMDRTGITPWGLAEALARHPAGVADRWFARLYPLKALVLATLALFWIASGVVALLFAYDEARAIVLRAGFGEAASHALTLATGALDIVVGALIAIRRTARAGLWTGIAVSVGYMAGATLLAPELWLEPLGSLVKTVPATVLALLALATLDDR